MEFVTSESPIEKMRNRSASSANDQARAYLATPTWQRVLWTLGLFLSVICLSAVGGYLNRGRGGAVHPHGGYWFQHFFSRFLFSLPTGAVVGICSGSWRPMVVVSVLTSCSLVIGWGCYFDVTFQQNGWTSRSGVSDWLIGREEEGWPQVKVFYHNFAGMALRGLAWTAPPGYVLYHMGYGWQFSMTGCLMSTPYAFGWSLQSYSWMAAGQPWSETIWGYWIWVVSITSAIAGLLERLRENNSRSGHNRHTTYYLSSYITNRWLAILFEVWNALLTVIFLCSTIFYSMVQQRDTNNKAQTFFGMFVVTIALLGAQVVIYTAVWLAKYKDVDLTNELRGVAVLCQSPLIVRNQVRFPVRRVLSRQPTAEAQQFLSYQQSTGPVSEDTDSVSQRHELGFDSDDASGHIAVTGGLQSEYCDPRDALSRASSSSSDSDSDIVDWSMVLSAPSANINVWLRKLPYLVWHLADNKIYTSFPAVCRLVQGVIALVACGVVTYITISAVLWNLQGPRFLNVCTCTQ